MTLGDCKMGDSLASLNELIWLLPLILRYHWEVETRNHTSTFSTCGNLKD